MSSKSSQPRIFQGDVYINGSAASHTEPPSTNTTQIQNFHHSLPDFAPTPLQSLPSIAEKLGVRAVLIKVESSRLGLPAFKILGASWGVYRALCNALGADLQEPGLEQLKQALRRRQNADRYVLFAATDGNHGRAVARMASLLGLSGDGQILEAGLGEHQAQRKAGAVIYVPKGMYESTKKLIADEGAIVVTVEGDYDRAVQECWEASRQLTTTSGAKEIGVMVQDNAFEGYEIVPRWIVDGYSTLLAEVDQQFDELYGTASGDMTITHIVTPIGVGSLGHAVVRWAKSAARRKKVGVIAVEPETAGCLHESLKAGHSKTIETLDTIMSGMCCGTVSPTSWEILKNGVDASTLVRDWECHQTVMELRSHCGIEAGPCGAACLSGLRKILEGEQELRSTLDLNEKSVVVLLSTEGKREYPIPEESI